MFRFWRDSKFSGHAHVLGNHLQRLRIPIRIPGTAEESLLTTFHQQLAAVMALNELENGNSYYDKVCAHLKLE
jgi:hypothetical protein